MRRSETYYPNLAAFVERFVANVFCYHQSASVNMQWVSDWWRYPALVFPLDAMWRAYENARKAPGQMMIFYIQAASMLDRVFDKDRGIVASLDCKQNLTRKGEPLPCERPNRAWREPILETLSVPAAGGKEKQGNHHHANKEEKQWLKLIPRTASTRSWSRAGTASPSSCAPCTTS